MARSLTPFVVTPLAAAEPLLFPVVPPATTPITVEIPTDSAKVTSLSSYTGVDGFICSFSTQATPRPSSSRVSSPHALRQVGVTVALPATMSTSPLLKSSSLIVRATARSFAAPTAGVLACYRRTSPLFDGVVDLF